MDWRSIRTDGQVSSMRTAGLNMSSLFLDDFQEMIASAGQVLNPWSEPVSKIFFYAAGFVDSDSEETRKIEHAFHGKFPDAEVNFSSDLLAAARALFGKERGIAVILGTGSNTGEYDGSRIVRNILPGGYVLGDEGGAASLGKQFISDYIKGLVPDGIVSEVNQLCDMSYPSIVRSVYKEPYPARYLGSFAPFLAERYEDYPYVMNLVDDNFRALFERCLSRYRDSESDVGVVGSFGQAMKHSLTKVAAEYNMTVSRIIESPADHLARYHYEGR